MNYFRILIFTAFFIGVSTNAFAQYITVSESLTVNQLVVDKLINNPCAEISNISVSGIGTGGNESYGYFTAGTSNFPFADGIVLCTGPAVSAEGPNSNILSQNSDAVTWPGDEDFRNALGVSSSLDATILEFDFRPIANAISFDYIFSSEQYLSNPSPDQCGFTDGFVFLLKEANSTNTYQNLAIVPGTTLPVTVNNVRGSGTICPPANEQYFDAFNGVQHPTNFNGQTKSLIAAANVTPGTLYHIKIVVADQGNKRYDSAIFLKGGSFNIGTNLGSDKLIANQNPLCAGEKTILNATQSAAISYKWFKNGNLILDAISGLPITTPTYEVTDSGTYKVAVEISATCTSTDEIVIEYVPLPIVFDTVLVQCDSNSDGISIFDLSKVTGILTGNDANLSIVNYYKTLQDAKDAVDQILNPTTFSNSVSNTVYVRIKNQFGCVSIAKIDLQISNNTISPKASSFCDTLGPQDGIATFTQQDFNAFTTSILAGLPTGLSVVYYTNYTDDLSQMAPIVFPFTNTIALQQIVYARVANGSDCYGIVPVTVTITPFLPPNFDTEIIGICSGIPQTIAVQSGFVSYVWTPTNLATGNQISVATAGIYSVVVTNANGCKATKEFQVEASESATIQNIVLDDFNGNANTVLINYSGSGDYEFSLDGINFQDSPYFTDFVSGEYTLVVKDKKGCLPVSSNIIVLAYPTFFTPNNDGYNDIWKIKNIDTRPNSSIQIFDRFGKLLGNYDTDTGWNGKFNQRELPSDDYWFVLQLATGKLIKGHFALKR